MPGCLLVLLRAASGSDDDAADDGSRVGLHRGCRRGDRIVAVKLLPDDKLQDAAAVARFEREMKAVGKLELHAKVWTPTRPLPILCERRRVRPLFFSDPTRNETTSARGRGLMTN